MKQKINYNERYYDYAYLSVYVDDICICICHENLQVHAENIVSAFDLKTGSVNFPDMYLGINVKIKDTCTYTEEECFAMGENDYVKDVCIVETQIKKMM